MKSPFLTPQEIVTLLPEGRGSLATVRFWIASGKLPSHKFGRNRLVLRKDVAAFMGCSQEDLGIAV